MEQRYRVSRRHRVQCRIWTVFATLGALLLTACGGIVSRSPFGDRRLDILTEFTIAIQKGDFDEVLQMIDPDERSKMTGLDGEIPVRIQEKFRRLKPARLYNHPFIRIERGKIQGLPDVLPVVSASLGGDYGFPGPIVAMNDPAIFGLNHHHFFQPL